MEHIKRIILILLVLAAVAFSWAVYVQGTSNTEAELIKPEAKRGKMLWQNYNCIACHQLFGLGGYMGPDLTNVMSAEGKGQVYVDAILMTGTGKMPNFHLSEQERIDLEAYLSGVDKSGRYPLNDSDLGISWGSFEIKKHLLNEK